MAFQAFQTIILSELQARMGNHYHFSIQKVPKNNGRILYGLSIRREGESIAPIIYLDSFFRQYQAGTHLEDLIDQIMNLYLQNQPAIHQDYSLLFDFEHQKDHIVYRLIHTQSNADMLQNIPSIPYYDLSIVFYLFLKQQELHQMSVLITNQHATNWNLTPSDLYQLAAVNTPQLFPAKFLSMAQFLGDVMPFSDHSMYILTNSVTLHGAAAILYPNLLKDRAAQLNQDLIILPSSIHEVLLLPYTNDQDLSELCDIVKQVNQAAVSPEEQLSNHIYLYSRQTDSLHSIPAAASPLF